MPPPRRSSAGAARGRPAAEPILRRGASISTSRLRGDAAGSPSRDRSQLRVTFADPLAERWSFGRRSSRDSGRPSCESNSSQPCESKPDENNQNKDKPLYAKPVEGKQVESGPVESRPIASSLVERGAVEPDLSMQNGSQPVPALNLADIRQVPLGWGEGKARHDAAAGKCSAAGSEDIAAAAASRLSSLVLNPRLSDATDDMRLGSFRGWAGKLQRARASSGSSARSCQSACPSELRSCSPARRKTFTPRCAGEGDEDALFPNALLSSASKMPTSGPSSASTLAPSTSASTLAVSDAENEPSSGDDRINVATQQEGPGGSQHKTLVVSAGVSPLLGGLVHALPIFDGLEPAVEEPCQGQICDRAGRGSCDRRRSSAASSVKDAALAAALSERSVQVAAAAAGGIIALATVLPGQQLELGALVELAEVEVCERGGMNVVSRKKSEIICADRHEGVYKACARDGSTRRLKAVSEWLLLER